MYSMIDNIRIGKQDNANVNLLELNTRTQSGEKEKYGKQLDKSKLKY